MNIPPIEINNPLLNPIHNKTNSLDYDNDISSSSKLFLSKTLSSKTLLTPKKASSLYSSSQIRPFNSTTSKKIEVAIGIKLKRLNLILPKPRNSNPKIINSPLILLNELEKNTKSNFNNKYNFLIRKDKTRNCFYPSLNSSSTNLFSNSMVKALFPNHNKNDYSQEKEYRNRRLILTKRKPTVNLLFENRRK